MRCSRAARAAVWVGAALACHSANPLPPERQPLAQSELLLRVGSACGGGALANVSVVAVTRNAVILQLGVTDGEGELHVKKGQLRTSGATFLVLCKELFFCGALPVTDAKFFAYDERYFELAPIAVQ